MSALPFPEADLSAEDKTYVTGCLVQKNSCEGPERKGHTRMGVKITGWQDLHSLHRSRLDGWMAVLSEDLRGDPWRAVCTTLFCLSLKVIFLQQIVSK